MATTTTKTTGTKQGTRFYERLAALQNELKAPKNKYNSFSNFHYRSCEDIYEAVKPLLVKYQMQLNICDYVEQVGNRYYVKACAHLKGTAPEDFMVYEDGTETWAQETSIGWAREEETKKGMDGSQITGTASSYARKYALNGLLLIDDTKDADTDEYQVQTQAGYGKKVTPQIDLDAYLSEIAGLKTGNQINAWWKKNSADIPTDIKQTIYDACVERGKEVNG